MSTSAPQGYPNRPIRLMVSQAAGGPTDVIARIYAARMSELLGQQLVADNRQSSGGAIAGEITVRAPADGYTLLAAANGTIAVAPHLVKLTFDARKDLVPVALIGNSPLGLMVHPPLPVNSVKELVMRAKERPGTINFGSAGPGATSHLAGEMLKMLAGINIVHVPYKGAGAAAIGLISGEINMMVSGLSSSMAYIKQKQLRVLGVSSAKRVALMPDVPTIAETVAGYEVGSWYAVFATAGTPRAIVQYLNRM
ncbi:MAG: tripartite tricarboxylate transporter substrate binding protein, partial [Burkholderiales bacterium]